MRISRCILLLFLLFSGKAGFLRAAGEAGTVLGVHDWDPDPSPNTWDGNGVTIVAEQAGGGNPGDWLGITFTNLSSDAPGPWWYDVITTSPASNLYAGVWSTNMWVDFDFWADDVEPTYVQVRWGSTNNHVWRQTVFDNSSESMATQSWDNLTAGFSDWNDWKAPGYTEAEYYSDLAAIDWIGVSIYRNTTDQQLYGIDNFMLMVPEPAEILMLLVTLCFITISFRKKSLLRDSG